MRIFDWIITALMLTYFWTGWRTGFLRSLIGPLSLLAGTFAALVHYDLEKNLIAAISIAIGGSLALSFGLRVLLFLASRGADKKFQDHGFPINRIFGGLLSLGWKGSSTLMMVFLFSLLPPFLSGGSKAHDGLLASQTYTLLNRYVLLRIPSLQAVMAIPEVFSKEKTRQAVTRMPEFAQLQANPKVQDLLQDEKLMAQLEAKEIDKVILNPKLKAVLDDPEAMKTLTKLSQKIYEKNLGGKTQDTP